MIVYIVWEAYGVDGGDRFVTIHLTPEGAHDGAVDAYLDLQGGERDAVAEEHAGFFVQEYEVCP